VEKAVSLTNLIMQRLHQDDPSNLFLQDKKNKHYCLPAELSEDLRPAYLARYYVDGLLDPKRLSRSVLQEYKRYGEYIYSAQFRQNPIPPGGGMFKTVRIKHGTPPTSFSRMCRFWDKAGTKDDGNFTVGVLMGVDHEGRFWILDVKRFQEDSYEREQIVLKTANQDGYGVIIGIEQEGASGGKESAQNSVRRLAGFRVRVCRASASSGDKVLRADAFSVQVNAGNVYCDKESIWFPDFVDEMRYFPHSKYDDQVDASSGAFNILAGKRRKLGGMSRVAA
jgi:predicted phage terminase large subunit-like protein